MMFGIGKKQGLRRSYFFLPLVSLLSLLILSVTLAQLIRINIGNQMEELLSSANSFVVQAIRYEGEFHDLQANDSLNEYIRHISTDSRIRITVIDLTGTVLADNRALPGNMGNHIDREEIRAALQGHPRFVSRFSATLGSELMYYATRITIPGSEGLELIVRTAIPLDHVRNLLSLSYRVVFIVSMVLMALSLVFIILQLRAIQKPLARILDAAGRISNDDWEVDLYILRPYEFARIAQAIKQMAKTLQSQIISLKEQKADLQRILNFQKDIVVVLDAHQIIIQHNRPAESFLLKDPYDRNRKSSYEENSTHDDKRLAGTNLMTYLRSSELNAIFDQAYASGKFQRGSFRVYGEKFETYECYVTPFSGRPFDEAEDHPQLYLLVIYEI